MRLSGVKEIDAVLKGLPKQLQHRVLVNAHAAAAKPLIRSAQSKINRVTGRLQDSIGVIKSSTKSSADRLGMVTVGPRRGGSYKGYHGHLIEFGHWSRPRISTVLGFGGVKLVRKDVGKQKWIEAKPFMKPAFRETVNIVAEDAKTEIAKKLESFMRRTIKKNA